jgi:hypothetical protein
LFLRGTAYEQGGVKLGKNLVQRQDDRNAVAIGARRKCIRRRLPDVPKGNFDSAVGKLGKYLIQPDRNCQVAWIGLFDFVLEISWQATEDATQGNGNARGTRA